jgi:hypothetical protein
MLQDFSSPIESEDDPFCGWKTAKLFMSPENLRDIKGWDAKKD